MKYSRQIALLKTKVRIKEISIKKPGVSFWPGIYSRTIPILDKRTGNQVSI